MKDLESFMAAVREHINADAKLAACDVLFPSGKVQYASAYIGSKDAFVTWKPGLGWSSAGIAYPDVASLGRALGNVPPETPTNCVDFLMYACRAFAPELFHVTEFRELAFLASSASFDHASGVTHVGNANVAVAWDRGVGWRATATVPSYHYGPNGGLAPDYVSKRQGPSISAIAESLRAEFGGGK